MNMSYVVNVEYLKLFEPSILDGKYEEQVLPIVEDLEPHSLEELEEDTIMQCKE